MNFKDPGFLFLLWAILPVAGLLGFGIFRRKKILALFADPALYPSILPGFSMKISWIKAGLILGALVLAVIALAGPQAGFRWEETRQKGVDIMIALDCSQSMLAQDIKPNRLEQAKREIIDLTRLMHSDRAGLVAFAGLAVLQCPLTLDHEAFNIFLRVLAPDYLPLGGTNVAAALETCYNGFEKGSDTDKAIVLITDGENTAGDVDEILKKIAGDKIKIFCIGVGDPAGAPIPDPEGGFKKDGSGNIILSRVDDTALEKLAAATQGRYVRSVAGTMDLDEIYTQEILNTMERKTLTQGKKKVWEQRFQWALFPCVLLLILELFLPWKNFSLKKPSVKAGPAAMGFFFLVLVPVLALAISPGPAAAELFSSHVKKGIKAYEAHSFDQAKTHFIDAQLESPDDLRLYYNIGAAAYMEEAYDQAEKNFAQAARSPDPALAHQARYNLANTQYRMGKLDEAIAEYESILASFPHDKEARENLEFVKQQKEQEAQKKQQDQKSDQDQKDPKKEESQKDQDSQENSDSTPDKDNSQEQKSNQDPEAQQGQTPENQDSPDLKSQDPDQKAGQNSDQNPNPENQDSAGPDPAGEENSDPAKTASQEAGASGKESGQPSEAASLLENRLNRLEDKPGMGMMPVIQKRRIERDW